MTTSEAVERIQNIIERVNHINRGVHFMDKDLKSLDKAIEVMRERLECQHPYSFVHSRCFGEINQCLLCGEEL